MQTRARIAMGIGMGIGMILGAAPLVTTMQGPHATAEASRAPRGAVTVDDRESLAVAMLTPEQAARYRYWADRGVRFEDSWAPQRVALVVSVLDRFAEALGDTRFQILLNRGVSTRDTGGNAGLTIGFDPHATPWIASWNPETGRITLSESLFDATYVSEHYRWRFLGDLAQAHPEPVSVQAITIGHELGHLIADAMREEHVAQGMAPSYLEDAYAATLNVNFWANPLQEAPNESLASEIALWVYGVRRPRQARAYISAVLEPALTASSPSP